MIWKKMGINAVYNQNDHSELFSVPYWVEQGILEIEESF